MKGLTRIAAALGLCLVAAAASAQQAASALPAGKPIKIIVPFAAGGTSDILGRMLAQRLGERLGRTVIVDNRAGAGGSIGTEAAVNGDPDGTTILVHSGAIAVDPSLKRNLSYDVQRDLTPVTTAVVGPFVLLVNPALPVKTTAELVKYAKANPGKLNYGSPGIGSSIHMTTEYFKSLADIDLVHVPYKGAGPALAGAMGNEVQVLFDPLATGKKYAQSDKLRALAVSTGKRTDLWPEMPTVAEGGVPGFDTGVWYGIYVPAKTPKAIVDQLNAEFVAILKSPELAAWLRDQGLEAVANTPAQAKARLAEDIERWARVIKSAGLKTE
ncbi:MAG: tripartite tricarboxylate transporter substrate binding protein [Reyranella sp.]|uniref:tripartite tricarboxylate transporter substrate binding protein n=1 Tax=Reyranella sp. TaxID=1929291 RepID=UPI003D114B4B